MEEEIDVTVNVEEELLHLVKLYGVKIDRLNELNNERKELNTQLASIVKSILDLLRLI